MQKILQKIVSLDQDIKKLEAITNLIKADLTGISVPSPELIADEEERRQLLRLVQSIKSNIDLKHPAFNHVLNLEGHIHHLEARE